MKYSNHFNQPVLKLHLTIISIGIALGLLIFHYINIPEEVNISIHPVIGFSIFACSGIIASYMTHFISKKMDKAIRWQFQLANRILTGIVIHFLTLLAFFGIISYVYFKVMDVTLEGQSVLLKLGIIIFVIVLLYNVIYFAFYSYHVYSKLQLDTIAYERKQIDLQLKALKSQLSSHFLFNNLNTISSLVDKDKQLAEDYTRGLASIYNYTLNSYHRKWVTLDEELTYVHAYLLLIKTRFGGAFEHQVTISKTIMNSKIPPLTLQMLIENAVKHNIVDDENKLQIVINGDDHHISIKNNVTKAPANIRSFNIGLKNIASRYRLLSNATVNITKNSHFIVELPVIQS